MPNLEVAARFAAGRLPRWAVDSVCHDARDLGIDAPSWVWWYDRMREAADARTPTPAKGTHLGAIKRQK